MPTAAHASAAPGAPCRARWATRLACLFSLLLPLLLCPTSRAACAPGAYGTTDAACAPCPLNRYTAVSNNNAACSVCAASTYTTAPGGTGCVACTLPGVVLNAATSECTACPVGQFCASGGLARPCLNGTFASAPAASSCAACTAGVYAPMPGLSACIACAPGTYASANASVACIACGVGTYASSAGAAICVACTAGAVAPVAGASACLAPLGLYAAQNGAC